MESTTRKLVKDYGLAVGVAVTVALLIRFFVIEAYRIPNSAMHPTLDPGDTIFVAKWPFGLRFPGQEKPFTKGRTPERGEVVIFSMPQDETHDYIKRVIGLPGDQIELRSGYIWLNGKQVTHTLSESNTCGEEFLPGRKPHGFCIEPPLLDNFPRTTVPSGQVFVVGDFRAKPRTETLVRNWGLIPTSWIKGKALYVWLSLGPRTTDTSANLFPHIRFERMLRRIE